MLTASTIQILEQDSLNLVILCTPLYIRAALFILGALIPLVAAGVYSLSWRGYTRSMLRNIIAMVAAVCLATPFGFAASESLSASRLTFSGRTGIMVLDRSHYGMNDDRYSIPLTEINHVSVVPAGPDVYALRFVLNSGHSFIVAGHMRKDDSAKIGTAINSFVTTN